MGNKILSFVLKTSTWQWDQISSLLWWIRTSAGPFDLSLEWQRESAPASPLWYDLQTLRQKQSLNYPSRNWKVWKVPLRYCCPSGRQSHQRGLMRAEGWPLQSHFPWLHMEQHRAGLQRKSYFNWFQNIDAPVFLLYVFIQLNLLTATSKCDSQEIWVLTNPVGTTVTSIHTG